jgi:hypothetical protein
VKTVNIGLAFVLLGLYGTNPLLAKLVEKGTPENQASESE